MKVIETQFSRYTVGDDGVATATPLKPELPRTLDLMTEALDDLEAFLEEKPRPVLWDPRAVVPLRPGVWRVIIERLEKIAVGLAILVEDMDDHGLGSFPVAIDSLLLPVRLFTDENEARSWLQQFVGPAIPAEGEK